MKRYAASLLLSIALGVVTLCAAQAQRGGRAGGISAARASGGSRGGFSSSFSRAPQAFRPPSGSFGSFGSFSHGLGASRIAGYGQPAARYRAGYPSAYSSSRRPDRGRGRGGYGRPYRNYGYGTYLVPNVVGYPFGYDWPFDDEDYNNDDDQSGQSAAQSSPAPAMYPDQTPDDDAAPPFAYPEPPYPMTGSGEEPGAAYRPAYQAGQGEPPAAQPPTTLVFQDGRPVEQVHNYALTKTTLYDLDGNGRKEIPLAELDLPATIAANRSAGVDFSLPASY